MPDPILVDTDVFSYVLKGAPEAEFYKPHLADRILVLSFMTVAELEYWVRRNNWGPRRREGLDDALRGYVVHPFNRSLTSVWASLRVEAEGKGRTLGHGDGWIAATAKLHGLQLLTNNAKDYDYLDDLRVITRPSGLATPHKN